MAYGDNPGKRTPAKPKKLVKKKPYTLPKSAKTETTTDHRPAPKKGPVAPQQTGKVTRPAPKRQPGPSSDKERKRVRRHKETEQYQSAIQEARKHGPATRRGTSRPGGDDKSDADRARAKDYVRRQYVKEYGKGLGTSTQGGKIRYGYRPGSTVPPDVQKRTDKRNLKDFADEAGAERMAPVGKALEQTTRPLHAIAGAARHDVKQFKKHGVKGLVGHGSLKAAEKGIKNETKNTFSDVLGEAGVKNKAVKAAVGFGLDVALDPVTYVSGGSTTTAKLASKGARKTAEKKATKAGLNPEQVTRMGDRAAKQAEKKAGDSRGVKITVAGQHVPGVTRATAKAGRGVKKASDKPRVLRKVKDTARHIAADVNPNIKPDNISRTDYDRVRQATRTARNSTAREIEKVKHRAAAVRKELGDEDQKVIDAIEAGTRKKLPEHLRPVAKRLEDDMKHARRLERRAGINVPKRKGYFPHALKEPLEKGEGIQSVGSKTIRPGFAKGRKEKRTLAEIRKDEPNVFSEDAALVTANRKVESIVATKKAELNRTLLDMGRRLKKGSTDILGDGEAIVHIKGSDVRILNKKGDKTEVDKLLREGSTGRGGQYVILNEQTVDRAIKGVVPHENRSTIGRIIDKGQGGWKWLATVPNPGFHLRNLVGDTQNAYLAENAGKLAVNARHSGKALKRLGKREEALRTLDEIGTSKSRSQANNTHNNPLLKQVGPTGKPGIHIEGRSAEHMRVVARDANGQPVGHYEIMLDANGRKMGGDVYVVKDARRRGLASAMLAKAEAEGVKLDGPKAFHTLTDDGKAFTTAYRTGTAKKKEPRFPEPPRTTVSHRLDPDGKGLKIGGKHTTYDELLDEAEKVGAIRSGFINRELPELVKSPEKAGVKVSKKVDGKTARAGRSVKRTLENREDLMRLATYIGGRKRGLTPEQATARMAKYHFDYADLTTFERSVMRRLMPFYTFSARNIPLQLKSYFTKPGKFANYQKIREETAKAFGLDLDQVMADSPEYEQRAAGIPVKWKDTTFTLSLGPSGLPLTDLNEMPLIDGDPVKTASEWMNRFVSLTTPLAKSPVEIWSNFSFFFRDQIERETGPLVAAPVAVAQLPEALRKKLGVVDDYVDPRSGKKGYGWPAKADYIAAQLMPGPLGAAKRVLTPSEQKGKDTKTKLLAYGGVRAAPVDPVSTKIQRTYEQRAKEGKKQASLRQRANPKNGEKISAENPTPEYTRSLEKSRELTDTISALREKRGDKVIPRRGRPSGSKGGSRGSGDSFWDSSGSSSSSSDSFWK